MSEKLREHLQQALKRVQELESQSQESARADIRSPTFTALPDFLFDIQRSLQYFKDHQSDVDPPMPRLIKQGASSFVITKEAERYKRRLMELGGKSFRGRPRKSNPENPPPIAA